MEKMQKKTAAAEKEGELDLNDNNPNVVHKREALARRKAHSGLPGGSDEGSTMGSRGNARRTHGSHYPGGSRTSKK